MMVNCLRLRVPLLAAAFFCVTAQAQAPVGLARIFLPYKLSTDGSTAPIRTLPGTWGAYLYVDPPLRLTLDAAGFPHISIDPAELLTVHRDVYIGALKPSYTLAGVPTTPVSLYVNGLLQFPTYYDVTGTTLTPNSGIVAIGAAEIVITYLTLR